MSAVGWIAGAVVRLLAKLLLKVDVVGLERIPPSGPVILVINHVNLIDAPLLYTLMPRQTIGLSKIELWSNPVLGAVAKAWHAIPIRRGELDLDAIRQALQTLREGKVLGVAPEGTRSHHGRLQRGRPGAVLLALRAPEALIVPAALFGHEGLADNLRWLRRTPVHVSVGSGFHLELPRERISHEMRQQISDEIMWQIAALLPPRYRGFYDNLKIATERYVRFPSGVVSNLQLALVEEPAATPGAEP